MTTNVYKCDIQEPMMGGTIPLYVMIFSAKGEIKRVVVQPEGGFKMDMRRLTIEEVSKLFKD